MTTPGLPLDSRLSPAAPSTTIGSTSATIDCPDCHSRHAPDAGSFCEICGYNFTTASSANWPGFVALVPDALVPDALVPDAPIPPVAIANPTPTGWSLTIAIDPGLWDADYSPTPPPVPPANLIPQIALRASQALIGRTSSNRAIHPEVPLDFDNAVSQRHALIHHQGDRWLIRDLDSSNGTRLNGSDLPPLTDRPLQGGDRITLGHWTCITVIAP